MSVGETTTRKRYFNSYYNTWTTTVRPKGGTPVVNASKYLSRGSQITISTDTLWPIVNNPKQGRVNGHRLGSTLDLGANFYSSMAYSTAGQEFSCSKILPSNAGTVDGSGLIQASVVTQTFVTLPNLTSAEQTALMAKGSTAIARCNPTNPIAGLSNFLGETYRDGLPLVPGKELRDETSRVRGIGSEYLNYQFAISPTVSDLRKFGTAVRTHGKVLKQYVKDSGKGIRRGYKFPTTKSVVITKTPGYGYPGGFDAANFGNTTGTMTTTVTTEVDTWFSGKFVYFLDPDNTSFGKTQRFIQLSDKLLGTTLTPEVVWNLAPWSWAVDWVTNAGDVLANVSSFLSDGLVMRYGYIMEQKTITTEYLLEGWTYKSGLTTQAGPPVRQTVTQVRKVRLKASPFGFGLNLSSFTPRQIAIITALGMSRSPSLAK